MGTIYLSPLCVACARKARRGDNLCPRCREEVDALERRERQQIHRNDPEHAQRGSEGRSSVWSIGALAVGILLLVALGWVFQTAIVMGMAGGMQ